MNVTLVPTQEVCAPDVIAILTLGVNIGLTVMVKLAVVAHCPAVGVKV